MEKRFSLFLSVFLIIVFISPVVLASRPKLDCPSFFGDSYNFEWRDKNAEKVELFIGYNRRFVKDTYVKLETKDNPIHISKTSYKDKYRKLEKFVEKDKKKKLYAKIVTKGNNRGKSSKICRIKKPKIEKLNWKDWKSEGRRSSAESYNGKKSLKVNVKKDTGDFWVGPDLANSKDLKAPFNLKDAKISAWVYTPDCDGGYGKNYLQIHARGYSTKYGRTVFWGSDRKWRYVETDVGDLGGIRQILLKFGIRGKCDSSVLYIDDFKIENNGKVMVYDFE